MTIDWNAFTPWQALGGGVLIGSAAAMFVLLSGRIAGISGILGGLLTNPPAGDRAWRLTFVLGLVVSVWVFRPLVGDITPTIDADFLTLGVAGVLVGLGTRYGSGCTSGHGVCGLSRFSPRSLVATLSFMGAGFFTVFVLRHLI